MVKISASENIKKIKEFNQNIPNEQFQFILVIYIFVKMSYYFQISYAHSIKYITLVFLTVGTSVLAESIYYTFIQKYSKEDTIAIIGQTYPQTVGLIISAVANYGYKILPTIICTFAACFIARLIYGGYSKNIFSAPALTIIFLHSAFEKMMLNLSMNGIFDKYLLNIFNVENSKHIIEYANLNSALYHDKLVYLDPFIITSNIIFILMMFLYFKFSKIDCFMPLRIFLFLFLISYSAIGFLNGTSHLSSNFIHFNGFLKYLISFSEGTGHNFKALLMFFYLISSSTATGIILLTTYSYSLPKTRIGKYIVSFLIATIVFYTKVFTNNPYGLFYAIIIANFLTPMLEEKVKCSRVNKNITIIVLTILALISGFVYFVIAVSGV